MKTKISQLINKHSHKYELVAHIGGDTQSYAYQCSECRKRKVMVACDALNAIPSWDYVCAHGNIVLRRSKVE